MSPSAVNFVDAVDIVNIHQHDTGLSLIDDLNHSLNPAEGSPRTFPTILLYDAKGLKLFEKITYLDEYYLTNAEIEVLKKHAGRIVERIPENAQLVELGSGNLRKIEILLQECERRQKRVDYYALDLSLVELQRTFAEISPDSFEYVGFHGLHGTYDDALAWLKSPDHQARPTIVLSMGSSIGNFSRSSAADFLGEFSKVLKPSDFLLIGLDACKTPDRVYKAYNDTQGITRQFYQNGLLHANEVLGFEAFKLDEWDIVTSYDIHEGCHQASYSPRVNVIINGITIPRGERLVFEEAFKYGRDERDELSRKAGLISQVEFGNADEDYCCCSDIHLTRATRGKPTEPRFYQQIFERGIDPDVEDPEQCHSHSEIPDEWPPLGEILDYQERVRNRARSILQTRSALTNRCLGEALWIGFEHEAMHLETFLYMLLQSEKTLPPIGVETPDFVGIAQSANESSRANKWFRIPKQRISVGLDDSDNNAIPRDSFGWDNEKPQRNVVVHSFEAQARPVTNGEYAQYLHAKSLQTAPASWVYIQDGKDYPFAKGIDQRNLATTEDCLKGFAVRTVFGLVPLELARDWPVMASHDELVGYAKWMECRIPTFEEAQSIYKHAKELQDLNHTSNGHLYV
ncbi:hypothetical protein N7492_002560 [Penicillium capsulatum]|uniref:Histidine-specific methyltransferase SAM-dependent domain-containing protein n=1 Tax=Penicillium capsulatum TaxID=69766 RepID=A0A9W9LVT4_9EURO|nr:hypothetical protein N7492_002560 [Penicillium capsulatum]